MNGFSHVLFMTEGLGGVSQGILFQPNNVVNLLAKTGAEVLASF